MITAWYEMKRPITTFYLIRVLTTAVKAFVEKQMFFLRFSCCFHPLRCYYWLQAYPIASKAFWCAPVGDVLTKSKMKGSRLIAVYNSSGDARLDLTWLTEKINNFCMQTSDFIQQYQKIYTAKRLNDLTKIYGLVCFYIPNIDLYIF